MGKRRKGRRLFLLTSPWCVTRRVGYQIALMFIVMTIETEQLPVAAIWGIVVMVVVFVMDGELVQLFTVKFSSAVRTNPWKKFEGNGSIRLFVMR